MQWWRLNCAPRAARGQCRRDLMPVMRDRHRFCGERDCYDVLNVKRSATQEIKKSFLSYLSKIVSAYRLGSQLTVRTDVAAAFRHPDKKLLWAQDIFREVANAYEVLSDKTGNWFE